MWSFESAVGLMTIEKRSDGKYLLHIGDSFSDLYDSPVAAADNVYMFVTGCSEWDALGYKDRPRDVPRDIFEWLQSPDLP